MTPQLQVRSHVCIFKGGGVKYINCYYILYIIGGRWCILMKKDNNYQRDTPIVQPFVFIIILFFFFSNCAVSCSVRSKIIFEYVYTTISYSSLRKSIKTIGQPCPLLKNLNVLFTRYMKVSIILNLRVNTSVCLLRKQHNVIIVKCIFYLYFEKIIRRVVKHCKGEIVCFPVPNGTIPI